MHLITTFHNNWGKTVPECQKQPAFAAARNNSDRMLKHVQIICI